MKLPRFVRVLLYRLGWDSCDACRRKVIRRDRWHGKGWDLWGPWLHCPTCNAAMDAAYDEMMKREMAAASSRQAPI